MIDVINPYSIQLGYPQPRQAEEILEKQSRAFDEGALEGATQQHIRDVRMMEKRITKRSGFVGDPYLIITMSENEWEYFKEVQ